MLVDYFNKQRGADYIIGDGRAVLARELDRDAGAVIRFTERATASADDIRDAGWRLFRLQDQKDLRSARPSSGECR
ncbi:MAG: hypothetical protein JO365_31615 [Bradyrhizobium sp.]|nr:hypothetical protein [Bradyrhizobium sp.]